MATDIQLKRSSTSGSIPGSANVLVGEPVVNLADKVIYTKNGSGAIIVIGAGTTSNIAEGSNLYYTDARVQANVTSYLSTGNVTVGNIFLNKVYDTTQRKGNVGQILTSMTGGNVEWTSKFFSGENPPDFDKVNYGDIWFYTTDNRPYMWITDGTSDYFYDFLPPSF